MRGYVGIMVKKMETATSNQGIYSGLYRDNLIM